MFTFTTIETRFNTVSTAAYITYCSCLAHFLVLAFPVLQKQLTRYGTEPMSWDSVVITEIRLWARQLRACFLASARDFYFLQYVQNGSGAQPVGTRVISWRYCGQGMMVSTSLHLALSLRMSRATLLLSLHAFLPWTSTTYPFFRPGSTGVLISPWPDQEGDKLQ